MTLKTVHRAFDFHCTRAPGEGEQHCVLCYRQLVRACAEMFYGRTR